MKFTFVDCYSDPSHLLSCGMYVCIKRTQKTLPLYIYFFSWLGLTILQTSVWIWMHCFPEFSGAQLRNTIPSLEKKEIMIKPYNDISLEVSLPSPHCHSLICDSSAKTWSKWQPFFFGMIVLAAEASFQGFGYVLK